MATEPTPWIVAIGASGAEGLDDIKQLLAALPTTLPAIVMVVLHRSWNRPSQLQAVLARVSTLPVATAQDGQRLVAGRVYIGEVPDHLTLAANSFGKLIDDPTRRYGNRTVDLLFRSVAEFAGANMIGVVLSGSLDDGSRGLAAIHAAGGTTMVLTPRNRLHQGMPENAIQFDGPIDLIDDPLRLAEAIRARVCDA